MKQYKFIKPDPELKNNLMAFGYECGPGWNQILEELFDKIQELLDTKYKNYYNLLRSEWNDDTIDFEILQVKEKYGRLRIYINGGPEEISDLIDEAEKESSTICEECGQPGEEFVYHSWVYTRCPECRRKIEEK